MGPIISTELQNRVIIPCIAKCQTSTDLRTPQFQEGFEMTAEMEMRNLLQIWVHTTQGLCDYKSYRYGIIRKASSELQGNRSRGTSKPAYAAELLKHQETSTLARIEME